jgi:hypothetical protein
VAQRLQIVGSTLADVDPMHVGLPFAGLCIVVHACQFLLAGTAQELM